MIRYLMFFQTSIFLAAIFLLMGPIPLKGGQSEILDQEVHLQFTKLNWPMMLSARIEIPAPPEKVWNVLTDYDHLADFLPEMDSSRVVHRSEKKIVVEQSTRTHFLLFSKKIKVTLNIFEKENKEISFYNIDGNMELFSGKWILEEREGGESTRLTYTIEFKPSFYAPRWVIRQTLGHEIPKQLELISERAERLRSR